MKVMGIEAIYQKKNLSKASKAHKKHPYLLRGLKIDRPDQVWSSDITYIRMRHGFVYLVAIMDWQKFPFSMRNFIWPQKYEKIELFHGNNQEKLVKR